MKKKKIIIIVVVIIFILMLIPIPTHWKNGVTEYKTILYKYTKVHTPSEISFTGYEDGWELRILGIRVGGNIDADRIVKPNENKEQKNVGSVLMEVKEDTRSSKGATFIIKNTTNEEYAYGPTYIIEKFENQAWKEIDTLTGEPLTWNSIVYSLKAHEEKEFIIDWSLGYGELKSGTYRLVKSDLRKANSPESRSYSVYAEFDIK